MQQTHYLPIGHILTCPWAQNQRFLWFGLCKQPRVITTGQIHTKSSFIVFVSLCISATDLSFSHWAHFTSPQAQKIILLRFACPRAITTSKSPLFGLLGPSWAVGITKKCVEKLVSIQQTFFIQRAGDTQLIHLFYIKSKNQILRI